MNERHLLLRPRAFSGHTSVERHDGLILVLLHVCMCAQYFRRTLKRPIKQGWSNGLLTLKVWKVWEAWVQLQCRTEAHHTSTAAPFCS